MPESEADFLDLTIEQLMALDAGVPDTPALERPRRPSMDDPLEGLDLPGRPGLPDLPPLPGRRLF